MPSQKKIQSHVGDEHTQYIGWICMDEPASTVVCSIHPSMKMLDEGDDKGGIVENVWYVSIRDDDEHTHTHVHVGSTACSLAHVERFVSEERCSCTYAHLATFHLAKKKELHRDAWRCLCSFFLSTKRSCADAWKERVPPLRDETNACNEGIQRELRAVFFLFRVFDRSFESFFPALSCESKLREAERNLVATLRCVGE